MFNLWLLVLLLLQMARIKDAVDSISVQAAIEVLLALFSSNVANADPADETDTRHSATVVDTSLDLVLRFARVMSQATVLAKSEETGPGALLDWQKGARQWFISLMDALHKNAEDPAALEAL